MEYDTSCFPVNEKFNNILHFLFLSFCMFCIKIVMFCIKTCRTFSVREGLGVGLV